MNVEKLIKEITDQIKEKKDYAPLVGAIVGLLLSGNKDVKDKIVNSLIGAGLGYLVKSFIKKEEE